MTDSVLKPAEFRPATNYDTNPYYDENFDHSVVDPLKKIDAKFDEVDSSIDGLQDQIDAIDNSPFFVSVIMPEDVTQSPYLDVTYEEIENALLAGRIICELAEGDYTRYGYKSFEYLEDNATNELRYSVGLNGMTYSAATKDGRLLGELDA